MDALRSVLVRRHGLPRQQNAAILFADIRGFTTISESMPPLAVMEMLQAFYSRIEEVVHDHDGTLEKYIGDAILATFGVPASGSRDATDAFISGCLILDVLHRWNLDRIDRGQPPLGVGVGLNYGPVVAGRIVSWRAASFAVIGDTVNTASRLQGVTRKIGYDLVASDALVKKVRQERQQEALPLLETLADKGDCRLSGRVQPVRIHALRNANVLHLCSSWQ